MEGNKEKEQKNQWNNLFKGQTYVQMDGQKYFVEVASRLKL